MNIHKQETEYTCGPACVKMILQSEGIYKTEKWLSKFMHTNKKGTLHKYFPPTAKKFNFSYLTSESGSISEMKKLLKNKYKIIACHRDEYGEAHYSIVNKIGIIKIRLIDPYKGKSHTMGIWKFKKSWYDSEKNRPWLIALKKNKSKNDI